jgi:hypothetical protein
MRRIAIVSDIHYAGPRESAHGADFEFVRAKPSLARKLGRWYRHFIWLRNPLAHNSLVDRFIERVADADLVVANGDYTCDVAGLGVSHDDALESVQLCLGKLRGAFGGRFHAIPGDHEFGKITLLGDHGGLRLQSWHRAINECALRPFWRVDVGRFVLFGVTSTLLALPIFRPDALAEEWIEWEQLRAAHLAEISAAFAGLHPDQRVVLFCHDPTALPFLWREAAVQARLNQVALTVVGHLHTQLVLWKSRLLAGIPVIHKGPITVRRITTALNEARHWRPFNVCLCPALAGIELWKAGGYLTVDLDEAGAQPPKVTLHRMPRARARQ